MTFTTIYACGSNGKHQLGLSHTTDLDILHPVFQVPTLSSVKDIICGGNHTLILLDNGDVYSTGDNMYGQCAHDNEDEHIKGFKKIQQINGKRWILGSAGYEFSILINESYEVYSCGFGLKGELGINEKVSRSPILIRTNWIIPKDKIIIDVRSCVDHTIMLLNDGSVYGWGNSRNGKIGIMHEKVCWIPKILQLGERRVKKIQVARDFTVLMFNDNKVEFLGKDRYDIQSSLFNSIASDHYNNIADFKTMWSSIHLLTKSQGLISLGNNSHSQIPSIRESTNILNSSNLRLFEVGSEHGLALTNKGQVVSWGWGEHGNCGVKKDSDTFDQINVLFEETVQQKVNLIKGGCSTTWVVIGTS